MTEIEQKSVQATMEEVKAANGRNRRRRWLAVILLVSVAGAAILAASLHSRAGNIRYETYSVQTGNLQTTVTATGNLEATNQVEVGSELSGIITSVTVDYNGAVQPGQPLAYLDDTKFKASVLKSRAEVASAKAKYQEALAGRAAAEKTLKRLQKTRELTKGKLPSLEELDQAEANVERNAASVDAAAAAIEIAKAALTLNETDLEKTVISSPIRGVVLNRNVEKGQTVAASLQAPILFTLAEDLTSMELQVDVDEADVGKVKEGQMATFSVDAFPEETFAAEITQVRYGAETADGVVTYKTVLKVANPNLLLRPGMTATADIVVQNVKDTLLLPNSALLYNPAQKKVAKEKRGFLSSLMPGPRRRPANRDTSGQLASKAADKAKVWLLDDQQLPVAVIVERIATDGAMTAVRSTGLLQGAQVVTNEIMPEK